MVGSGLFAAALLATLPTPAFAAPGESITSYDARYEVRADGTLAVLETIGYDFGSARRHGILRDIPVRLRYDDSHDRIYPIDDVAVSMDGSPVPVRRSSSGDDELLQVGDPDRTVTGVHTYVIGYRVRGALNGYVDHIELYWNLVGARWRVPIATATATVTAPAAIQAATCFAGTVHSKQNCEDSSVDGRVAVFHQSDLGNGTGLTAAIDLPVGSVSDVRAILVGRHDGAAGLGITPATAGVALGLAFASMLSVLVVAWLVGRDRHGGSPGQQPGTVADPVDRRASVAGAPPAALDTGPPDGLPPGLLGALVHQRVRRADITATIVDLAVRGHLMIREVARPSRPGKSDWELTRLTAADPSFLRYERTLFRALFRTGKRIRMSQLGDRYVAELANVQREMYAEMVARCWYRRSPDRARLAARLAGAAVLLASVALAVVLALTVRLALYGAAFAPAGVLLLAIAGWFPARTSVGSAVLARAHAFGRYLTSAPPVARREQERTFSAYLPYALVFGVGDSWADSFADLAYPSADRVRLSWYDGPPGWTASRLGRSFDEFAKPRLIKRFTPRPGRRSPAGTGGYAGAHYLGSYSDGGSGFSGGGFSGDAGGGGGGGSW